MELGGCFRRGADMLILSLSLGNLRHGRDNTLTGGRENPTCLLSRLTSHTQGLSQLGHHLLLASVGKRAQMPIKPWDRRGRYPERVLNCFLCQVSSLQDFPHKERRKRTNTQVGAERNKTGAVRCSAEMSRGGYIPARDSCTSMRSEAGWG